MAERPTPPAPDLGAALAASSCPVPAASASQTILMAHGGGGRLTQRLIESLFLPTFDNPALRELHDGAVLDAGGVNLAFPTLEKPRPLGLLAPALQVEVDELH